MAVPSNDKTDSVGRIVCKGGTILRDGMTLSFSAVIPDPIEMVLVIVHGLSEHRGRYRRLQLDLAKEGFASYAYDQRGFGESDGSRTHMERYADMLHDLKRVLDFVRETHPDRKVVILGHSFGGAVSAAFCIDYPNAADGLVLSAPAYDVPALPFRLRFIGALLNRLLPSRPVRYPSVPDWLSHDPAIGVAFRNDPLVQRAGTPRFYVEFGKMNDHLHQDAGKIVLPTLLLQGSQDRIVFPSGARALFERIGSTKKKILWYEGFYHEVFNEIGRERVIADVVGWLKETVR
ncbi:MAG: lysophospholipase [Candidatus Manganitrophus sp. SA1]|nr:lysophospholipase [Candidatus Manganitrophus morganii]